MRHMTSPTTKPGGRTERQRPKDVPQLHEFGPDGKGSLELGDSSGAAFWLPYREFQKYHYLTFPDKKSPSSSQQAASGITSPDACTPSPPAGMHPQFPNL